jgi:DNA-binding NtrC family response regulator
MPDRLDTSESNQQTTVLVIDDMPDVGETICRICRLNGIASEYLSNGDNLPQILRYTRVRGIIADIMMPDQDGYNIMKTVASYDRDLPMLMITGGESFLLDAADAMAAVYQLTRVHVQAKPISRRIVEQFLFTTNLLPRPTNHPDSRIDSVRR